MKKRFIVSLIKNGIVGGSLVADADAITYHTSKLTIPREYQHLVIPYKDICAVTKGWFFLLPTVTVKLNNGSEYTFAVFFSRKRLMDTLANMSA